MAKFPAVVALDDGRRFLAIWNDTVSRAWHQLFETQDQRSAAWDQINAGTASWDQPDLNADDIFGILRTSDTPGASGWRVRVSVRRMVIVGPMSWPNEADYEDPATGLMDHDRHGEFGIPPDTNTPNTSE